MAAAKECYTTSADGTRIGYLSLGSGPGPGILLIQGAGGTADNYTELASALSSHFTVHSVERRGRGRSPRTYTAQHTIERDVEDIQAVLRDTGSSRLFGLSSGAIIALEAARQLDEVTHVMAYEPPFYAPDKPMSGVVQLNRDIENEDYAAAALTIMQTSQMTPALFNYLPRFASYALLSTVVGINARLGTPGYTFKDLVAASRYDFNVVSAMQDKVDRLAEISGKDAVVVVHGSKSQAFFAPAAERVEKAVEGCKRVEVQGLDHASPWNRWSGGQPGKVAEVIMEFMV